jgi:hypothetical protein
MARMQKTIRAKWHIVKNSDYLLSVAIDRCLVGVAMVVASLRIERARVRLSQMTTKLVIVSPPSLPVVVSQFLSNLFILFFLQSDGSCFTLSASWDLTYYTSDNFRIGLGNFCHLVRKHPIIAEIASTLKHMFAILLIQISCPPPIFFSIYLAIGRPFFCVAVCPCWAYFHFS